MSSHVFHEIYLHLNWHTKGDRALLTPKIEPLVHKFLQQRCRNTKGVYLHAINGTATHLQLAINIDPFVTISDLVEDLKGACSRQINKQARRQMLQWQRGFGVVSFGKRQLSWVLEYIAKQKEHHQQGTTRARLEKVTLDDDGVPVGHG